MTTIFLHGGGDDVESRAAIYGRFVQTTIEQQAGPLGLVVAEATEKEQQQSFEAYKAIFQAAGVPIERLAPLFVSPTAPLTFGAIAQMQPSGVFVCGGITPFYHQSVCQDVTWVNYLQEANIPFCGTSAGAAVASQQAIVGGWQVQRGEHTRGILFSGAGEGLLLLTVASGLGLIPFAVDVHASQWGTLLRLIHAVELGLVQEGWAIDENTILEVGDSLRLYGLGQAYHVRQLDSGEVAVQIHVAEYPSVH